MKFLTLLIPFILFSCTLVALADDQLSTAQSALKEAGFYYGPINGEKSPETAAAIRRFQIRNGLQVTGELNQETLDSLSGAQPPAQESSEAPLQTPLPVVPPTTSSLPQVPQNPQPRQTPVLPPSNIQKRPEEPVDRPAVSQAPVPFSLLFSKSPYERAPQPVQRETFKRVQNRLGDKGFYDGPADGVPTQEIRRALASYQQARGLRPSGALDVETLHEMRLLPGESGSAFGTEPSRPRQRIYRGIEVR